MSRIGKLPIPVPSGVNVTVEKNHVTVLGPKGRLERTLPAQIAIRLDDGMVTCERPSDGREHRSLHGLTRTLVANMVTGVSAGDDYTSSLLVVNGLWSSPERFKVKGDVVVAIPSRELILVTGTENGKVNEFRRYVANVYAKGQFPLSQTLLVYRNNRFTKFTGN